MRELKRFREIEIIVEKREDGGLRVWSSDVRGFVLSHADCEAVFADIEPALEVILDAMRQQSHAVPNAQTKNG